MAAIAGLLIGTLFGLGLVVSGMTQPAKVLAFLDVAGDWDPSLAFVMGGAIAVYAPLYRMILRGAPLYAQRFIVFANSILDARLIVGSAIFGLGWGLAGFCPGPGIVSAGTGSATGLVFGVSLLGGMILFEVYGRLHAFVASRRKSRSGDLLVES